MQTCGRSQIFFICLVDPERGPFLGAVRVCCQPGGSWQTEWDIGTIDQDSQLSDHWFCRDQYQHKFEQVIRTAAKKSNSSHFYVPGATSRWGMAKGMRQQNALDLANQVVALWEQILVDWETRRGEDC